VNFIIFIKWTKFTSK